MELIRSGGNQPPPKKQPAKKPAPAKEYAPIHDAPTREASGLPPDPVTAAVSPTRAIKTLQIEANPVYAARQRMEQGLTPSPAHEESTTSLLLNSIGYTGNTVNDFNAAVDNINKTFEDVYGYAPTPGLVLDMLRSPVAHSAQALRDVLTGQQLPAPKAAPPNPESELFGGAQAPGPFSQPPPPNTDKAGLKVALQLAVASHMAQPFTMAVASIQAHHALDKQLNLIESGDQQAMVDSMLSSPLTSNAIAAAMSLRTYMNDHQIDEGKLDPSAAGNKVLFGDTLGPNQQSQLSHAGGGPVLTAGQNLQTISDIQAKIKANFKGITLPANGVWTQDWQKLALYMQSNKRWQSISQVQQAINYLGYTDVSLDPFKSVDQNGKLSPAAEDLVKRAQAAYKARQGALSGWWAPLMSQVIKVLPAGIFAQGGKTTLPLGLNINLGATARWVAGGDFSNPAGALESGVRNSAILFFDGAGGWWKQGKAYVWTASTFADPNFMSPSDIRDGKFAKELENRLMYEDPTWGKIVAGAISPVDPGGERLITRELAKHPGIDFGTDLVGDMVVGSLLTGPEMSTTDMASYAKMFDSMGRQEFALALMKREPVFAENTTRAFNLLKAGGSKGRAEAANLLDGKGVAERFLRQPRFRILRDGTVREMDAIPPETLTKPGERMSAVSKELADAIQERAKGAGREGAPTARDIQEATYLEQHGVLPKGAKFYDLATLVRGGIIDKSQFQQLAAEAFVTRGELFDTMKATNIPSYSSQLFSRMRLWNKGRLPIYTPHPFRWARGVTGRALSDALHQTDSWLWDVSTAGETKTATFLKGVRWFENQAHVQLTHAANPRVQPIVTMESANIRRLALKAGLPSDKAYALEGMFQIGRGRGDFTIIKRVENELRQAFRDHGRMADVDSTNQLFSVLMDRSTETDKFLAAVKNDPKDVFSPTGPDSLARTQWASLSAERYNLTPEENAQRTAQMEQDLKEMGFNPLPMDGVYGGDREKSFFVPGMTAKEAAQLGKKYDQESVLAPQGLFFTTGENAGKVVRTKGYLFGKDEVSPEAHSEITIGDHTYVWGWQGLSKGDEGRFGMAGALLNRGKQDAEMLMEQATDRHYNANPAGSVVPLTREQVQARVAEKLTSDEAKDVAKEKGSELVKENTKESEIAATKAPEEAPAIVTGGGEPGPTDHVPNLTSQMADVFSVPEAMMPRTMRSTGTYLGALNNLMNRIGLVNRELILATDPILFEKHGVSDGIRNAYAQWRSNILTGGPIKDVVQNRLYMKGLSKYLAEHPEDQRTFDQVAHFHQVGEYRYDLQGVTRNKIIEPFNTGHYLKDPKRMRAAADYVDRLISDGSYRAYQRGGPRGVFDFYHTNREAIRLGGQVHMKADELAQSTIQQIADIETMAPGFLDRALALKTSRGAKLHFRESLAKLIQKEKISIPVAGSIEGKPTLSLLAPLDEVSTKLIGAYMTPNKFYRGSLFQSIAARTFHDFKAAGMEDKHAFDAAMAAASKTTRYHMLDLADAMQWEQTLRWAAMFFTKHRLYWKWLYQTIKHRPYLAGAVQSIQSQLGAYQKNDPNAQAGSIDFNLPTKDIPVIGNTLQDMVGTRYRLPLARMMWLAASQANPGALSNMIHAATSGSSLIPGRGPIQYTTMDGAINAMAIYLHMKLDGKGTSDSAIAHMDPLDAARFRSIYDQMQVSYMAAHHGRPMPDRDATQAALLHFAVVNAWQSSAATGIYPTDPKLGSKQQAEWNHYNSLLDPKQREAYRAGHPWIDTMIGMSTTSPKQWVLSQQMWAKFNNIQRQHNANKEKLLASYRATGDPGYLFGSEWHAEGKRYGKEIHKLEAMAAHMGATEWLGQFSQDPLTGMHAAYASMLHELYPSMSKEEQKKVINKLDPPEIRHARTLLNGLTNSFISTFPVEERQSFQEARAYLNRVVDAFNTVPTDKVSKLRDTYFSKVYDQFATKYENFLVRANAAPSWRKPLVFEQLREYMDSIDHPVKVQGVMMPSPVRAKYALLPTDAKLAYRQSQMVKSWGFLTKFQKHILGIDVSDTVQKGWGIFYTDVAAALRQAKQMNPTKSISMSSTQGLEIAKAVDSQYPGFYQDYVRGLQPIYSRLQALKIGRTPGAQKAWSDYLGTYIQPLAEAVGGPATDNGPYMVERAKKFQTTLWTNLMEFGPTVGGTGWADTPSAANPQGGALYARAMQYSDPEFQREFKAMIANNPAFISSLFGPGA